jgi:hypothetical protein
LLKTLFLENKTFSLEKKSLGDIKLLLI